MRSKSDNRSKRLFDIGVAGALLLVSSPAIALLAAVVRLDSKGPALFFHSRVGRGQRPIRVAKLRTMVNNAEHTGSAITAARDPRVTRAGKFLRRTKLDELPQLWNVLKGDMTIVGPRPEVARYIGHYKPEWLRLLEVRPGLTDLASLTFRDEESILALAQDRERAYLEVVMPLKLRLALEGLDQSLLADLGVLLKTVLSVLGLRDPRAEEALSLARREIALLNSKMVIR